MTVRTLCSLAVFCLAWVTVAHAAVCWQPDAAVHDSLGPHPAQAVTDRTLRWHPVPKIYTFVHTGRGSTLWRSNLDGGSREALLCTDAVDGPCPRILPELRTVSHLHLEAPSGFLYWYDSDARTIARMFIGKPSSTEEPVLSLLVCAVNGSTPCAYWMPHLFDVRDMLTLEDNEQTTLFFAHAEGVFALPLPSARAPTAAAVESSGHRSVGLVCRNPNMGCIITWPGRVNDILVVKDEGGWWLVWSAELAIGRIQLSTRATEWLACVRFACTAPRNIIDHEGRRWLALDDAEHFLYFNDGPRIIRMGVDGRYPLTVVCAANDLCPNVPPGSMHDIMWLGIISPNPTDPRALPQLYWIDAGPAFRQERLMRARTDGTDIITLAHGSDCPQYNSDVRMYARLVGIYAPRADAGCCGITMTVYGPLHSVMNYDLIRMRIQEAAFTPTAGTVDYFGIRPISTEAGIGGDVVWSVAGRMSHLRTIDSCVLPSESGGTGMGGASLLLSPSIGSCMGASPSIGSPEDVQYDLGTGRMYWIDTIRHAVMMSRLDGRGPSVLLCESACYHRLFKFAPTGLQLDLRLGPGRHAQQQAQEPPLAGADPEDDPDVRMGPSMYILDIDRIVRADMDGSRSRVLACRTCKTRVGGMDWPAFLQLDARGTEAGGATWPTLYWLDRHRRQVYSILGGGPKAALKPKIVACAHGCGAMKEFGDSVFRDVIGMSLDAPPTAAYMPLGNASRIPSSWMYWGDTSSLHVARMHVGMPALHVLVCQSNETVRCSFVMPEMTTLHAVSHYNQWPIMDVNAPIRVAFAYSTVEGVAIAEALIDATNGRVRVNVIVCSAATMCPNVLSSLRKPQRLTYAPLKNGLQLWWIDNAPDSFQQGIYHAHVDGREAQLVIPPSHLVPEPPLAYVMGMPVPPETSP